MNISVIGANGFIGRHLLAHLESHEHRCTGFDLSPSAPDHPQVLSLDIETESPEFGPQTDAVVYLAQYPGYRSFPEGASRLFAVNVAGALRAAEEALRVGARTFIYASTGTVYQPSFTPMNEDQPVRRDQPYALSKVHAEEALALVDGLKTCCIRLFGVFGENQQTMLVPTLAKRVRDGEPITLEPHPADPDDDGGLRIALTHVSDVCSVVRQLLERLNAGHATPPILNVANPKAASIRQIACTLSQKIGRDPLFTPAPTPRQGDYIADINRLNQLINHEFMPLDQAIERTQVAHV